MGYIPKSKKDKDIKYKAYKYQLYPNIEQELLIHNTIGYSRLIYNLLLWDRIECYKDKKEILKREVSYYKKQDQYKFLKEVDFWHLVNAKIHLEMAYKNFFNKKSSFLQFKKKGIYDTYPTHRIVDKLGHFSIVLDIENRRIK